ncbi:MAG: phosphatase PAP2 family protein [Bacteroidales bacterium]|nr:phosphatase PAP2 family protein [Bacteroidales bacterium]
MKRLFLSVLLAAYLASPLSAQPTLYFSTEELPDLIQALPAPPDTMSAGFTYDIMRYMWGKVQRQDPERAEMACRDAVWSYEALIDEFDELFGLTVSREATPDIWTLLENSLATADQMRVAPKAYFHRKRPFERFHEAMLTGEEEVLSGEGSYPSGHTMRSWMVAQLLSEINPSAAEKLYARAWEYGESRVIAGAHWQSDVDISRVGASIAYARLQTSPFFRLQMARAQDEFQRLTGYEADGGRGRFVRVTDVVPDVILEIRYYSSYNFVGDRIDGYLAPVALLTREAADSLKAVSDDLIRQGYRIKIFDAYRPQMAVNHFVRWAADLKDARMKPYFYPDVRKNVLFKQGYIAEKSGHSRGSTVDLTLVEMATGKEVDMGGVFDWFGIESHPDYCGDPVTGVFKPARKGGLTERQFLNRLILRQAMMRHGFKPIDEEWWHFTLKDEPFPDTYFEFPVN